LAELEEYERWLAAKISPTMPSEASAAASWSG